MELTAEEIAKAQRKAFAKAYSVDPNSSEGRSLLWAATMYERLLDDARALAKRDTHWLEERLNSVSGQEKVFIEEILKNRKN